MASNLSFAVSMAYAPAVLTLIGLRYLKGSLIWHKGSPLLVQSTRTIRVLAKASDSLGEDPLLKSIRFSNLSITSLLAPQMVSKERDKICSVAGLVNPVMYRSTSVPGAIVAVNTDVNWITLPVMTIV